MPEGWLSADSREPLSEHHVDDTEHLAGVRVEQGAAAVARIGGAVQLEDVERAGTHAADRRLVETRALGVGKAAGVMGDGLHGG